MMDTVQLRERPGYTVSHQHEEGDPCRPAGDGFPCRYVPTLTTRLRRAFGRPYPQPPRRAL